ncbi:hypothetical protein BH10BAC2_BH10BAC2_32490 [soil metagenome]
MNWVTTNEINTAYFSIQRSFNGTDFTTIAKQNAAGSGIAQQYNYTDENIVALHQARIFYRLQSADKDGSSVYSNIISLQINASISVSIIISPNPNSGNFTIQIHLSDKATSTTLALYNSLGEKVWQQDAGKLNGSVSKNISLESKLTAGVYVLIIQHGDTRLMQKVVITK